MIQDDGSAIAINENGDSYSLSPEQVTQMVDNGQLNTADSGYVKATGGTGNTPGGSGAKTTATTKTTPTTPKTTTPTTSSDPFAAITAAGVLPGMGDVAHIKSDQSLFGILPGKEEVKAKKSEEEKSSDQAKSEDLMSALDEDYFHGGSVTNVDDLLHILRG
jgi:hypothetical protein